MMLRLFCPCGATWTGLDLDAELVHAMDAVWERTHAQCREVVVGDEVVTPWTGSRTTSRRPPTPGYRSNRRKVR